MANSKKLESKLRALPNAPGVYEFLDANGLIIYVGKSMHLRQRVRSYFTPSQKWEKVRSMLPFIDDVRIISCDTHLEARLLECRLIKEIQPRFNSQMKADGRYVYLDLRRTALPRVSHKPMPNAVGPFRSKWNLRHFLDNLKLLYPLRLEAGEIEFDFHVIPARLNTEETAEMMELLRRCLSEPEMVHKFSASILRKMTEAAELLQFERAAYYRELLPTLSLLERSLGAKRDFLSSEYHVRIPLGSAEKHFYIRNGLVVDTTLALSAKAFNAELFLFMAKALPDAPINEKAALDYRDIVYTEIENLPSNQIRKLDW